MKGYSDTDKDQSEIPTEPITPSGVAGLTEGRIVHYVLAKHDIPHKAGEHRPAMVVKVWNSSGMVNLQVFLDGDGNGSNDGSRAPIMWVTSIDMDLTNKARGTWHWIEKA